MTEETRPGFLANYKIIRPGPARPAQVRPGPARFGPARLTPIIYNIYNWESALARDIRGVAGIVKRESSDDVTGAAEKKQCFVVDEEDIKPNVEWTDYDDD